MDKIVYKGVQFIKPDYDERDINRGKTLRAIKMGIIKRKPCEICGDLIFESDAHHEKYADYLNVRWLCKPHHKTIHQIFKKINGIEKEIEYHKKELREEDDNIYIESIIWHIKYAKKRLKEYSKKYGVIEQIKIEML